MLTPSEILSIIPQQEMGNCLDEVCLTQNGTHYCTCLYCSPSAYLDSGNGGAFCRTCPVGAQCNGIDVCPMEGCEYEDP